MDSIGILCLTALYHHANLRSHILHQYNNFLHFSTPPTTRVPATHVLESAQLPFRGQHDKEYLLISFPGIPD